ncbi:MAG: hypothetical protein KAH01_03395 [Caldisericia bacterium]|nr:hypothetical protein [Caldisericia bacterium]
MMFIKKIFPQICIFCVIVFSLNGCSKNSTSKYVYHLKNSQDNQIHSVKSDFALETKNDEANFFHAVLSQNGELEQVLDIFYTDYSGNVKSNVRFAPNSENVLDENLLSFYETNSHLFLVCGLVSSGKDYNYTINFIPIDSSNKLLVGNNTSAFSSKDISVSNFCYFDDHFYISGQFSTKESQTSFGMVSTFLVDDSGEVNPKNVSIIQVPNNAKTGGVNSNVACIIPTFEKQTEEDKVDPKILFSTQNGYVGILSPNFITKNCCTVPGFTPGFRNSMFIDGDNLYLTNETNDSYDPQLIMIKPNGKTECINFFRQRPDTKYSFASMDSNPYSASKGLYGFGTKDSQLELVITYSNKKAKSWEAKSLNLTGIEFAKVHSNDLYLSGFSSRNSIINSAISFLFNSNNLMKWNDNFIEIEENTILDQFNSFMYYDDQQNNTLDCKIVDREVSFVKPLFVSDLTDSFFNIEKSKELVFKESKLIELTNR